MTPSSTSRTSSAGCARTGSKAIPARVFDVVVSASNEVRSGIVYATMIIVLVFVPLFALSGIEGRLFAPLGHAYIISILASLLVSITLTPVMAYYLLPGMKRLAERESWLVRKLKSANHAALGFAFAHRGLLLGVTALAVLGAGAGALGLKRAFLPAFNEGTFTINIAFNPGVSLSESTRVGSIAERLLLDVPEVISVGRRTGRAELDEHAEGIHSSDLEVDLKPSRRPKPEIVADIRSRLSVLPLSVNVGQPISHRLDHLLSGVRAELALKLFGDDLDTLRNSAEELRLRLSKIEGIQDLQVEKQVRIPQLEIRVDYTRAALYGVQPGAVTDQLSRLSSGRVISRVVDGYKRYDVVSEAARPASHHREARRPPDQDAVGVDPGASDRGREGDRWAKSDPARERPPAHRHTRELGRQDRHGGDRAPHSRRTGCGEPAAGRHREP